MKPGKVYIQRQKELVFGDVPESLNQNDPTACPPSGLSSYSSYFLTVKRIKRHFCNIKSLNCYTDTNNKENETEVQ